MITKSILSHCVDAMGSKFVTIKNEAQAFPPFSLTHGEQSLLELLRHQVMSRREGEGDDCQFRL